MPRRQTVRHRILVPIIAGSNPAGVVFNAEVFMIKILDDMNAIQVAEAIINGKMVADNPGPMEKAARRSAGLPEYDYELRFSNADLMEIGEYLMIAAKYER